jgi:hypothetical protein
VQRRHHYEQALEEWLRGGRVPYVAVDEARKALLPDGSAGAGREYGCPALKSFDLVIYGEEANLLAEVKGRRVGGAGGRSRRLECWVTREDVDSLLAWERLFGEGFRAAFLFVYWCEEQPPMPLFEEIFAFRGRWYAVRSVLVAEYATVMRTRSERWGTVHLVGADFDRLSTPFAPTGSPGTPGGRAPALPARPALVASGLE